MAHFVIHLFFSFIIFLIVIYIYYRQIRCKEIHNEIIKVLNKNVDFIIEYNKKQEINTLKNTIQLSSYLQIILKIAKSDYITFFKYDYSQKYVKLDFITSMSSDGTIIQNSILDHIPVTSNILLLDIIKSDDKDFYCSTDSEVKEKNNIVSEVLEKREVKKVYYQNVFKQNLDTPVGFITLAYKDENSTLAESSKDEIKKMIEKMKIYL